MEKIYSIINKHKDEISKSAAILIEDDLDGKFYGWTEQQKNDYTLEIKNTVWEKLGKIIPIFIFFASPEIESWFLADWENAFGYIYCSEDFVPDLNRNVRKFFVHHLKDYIEGQVLKEDKTDIESFGMVDGKYEKLSDQIVLAVQTDSKIYIENLKGVNPEYVSQIRNSKRLYYSKKLHGDAMLRKIEPIQVAKKCLNYFRTEFYHLKEF